MKRLPSMLDRHDLQLVTGISLLGYGLFLVYPPACPIAIGSLLLAPIILPPLVALWGSR